MRARRSASSRLSSAAAASWLVAVPAARAQEKSIELDPDPLTARGLVQQVTSETRTPHVFDWRNSTAELHLGIGYIDEANNFDNEVYELMAAFPTSGGFLPLFGVRRVIVMSTPAGHQLARTPFRQSAGVTRYEIVGGMGWSILEGRAMTRLSPWIADLEHTTMLHLAAHYSHPNKGMVPKRTDRPDPLPGQDPVNATVNLELGVRWHVYLPRSLGLYFQGVYNRPFGGTGDLDDWVYFSTGVLWAFGGK